MAYPWLIRLSRVPVEKDGLGSVAPLVDLIRVVDFVEADPDIVL